MGWGLLWFVAWFDGCRVVAFFAVSVGYCDLFLSVGLCCWYCVFCGVRAGRLVFWWLLCYWFGLLCAVLSYCLTSVAFSLWWGL